MRVSTLDGREFIQTVPLQVWTRPFDPLPPPRPTVRQQDKEARRRREVAKKAKEMGGGAGVVDVTAQFEALKPGESSSSTGLGATSAPVEEAPPTPEPTSRLISHFVMNLPGSALEFLDAYNGCYKPLLDQPDFPGKDEVEMPFIHVHCFSKEPEGDPAVQDLCKASLRVWDYLPHLLCSRRADLMAHPVASERDFGSRDHPR